MPSIGEQMTLVAVGPIRTWSRRFLLKPGRKYEEAVKAFAPYEQTKK